MKKNEFVLVIDSNNQHLVVEPVEREDGGTLGLEFFLDKLDCKYIDIVRYGKYDIYVDDEGMYNSPNRGFVIDGNIQLFGNAVVCMSDREGNSIGFDSVDDMPTINITDWFFSLSF